MQVKNSMNRIRNLLVALALCAALPAICLGQTFAENPGDGPDIWADWTGFGDPILGNDFTVDFNCGTCEDSPEIDLLEGDPEWQIWSVEDANPGDIGKITSAYNDDFGVKILDDEDGAGARHVVDIDLDPTSASNYSSITTVHMTGNLTGDVFVQRSSGGSGGVIGSLTVDGDVSGTITAYSLGTLSVGGSMSGSVDAAIVSNGIGIAGELSGTIKVSDKLDDATLSVSKDVTATGRVDILEVDGYCLLLFGTWNADYDFAGDLILGNGVPPAANVVIYDELTRTGSIDLKNGDLHGDLAIYGGGDGQIIDGGEVTSSVMLASGSSNTFSGRATFSGATGSIGTSNLNGQLTITGDLDGLIYVDDDLQSQGRVVVEGLCDGWVRIGQQTVALSLIHLLEGLGEYGTITVNHNAGVFDANGTIQVGPAAWSIDPPSVTFDGSIAVNDNGSGSGGNLDGAINVVGCHATPDDLDVCVDGDGYENITITQTDCANQVEAVCGG